MLRFFYTPGVYYDKKRGTMRLVFVCGFMVYLPSLSLSSSIIIPVYISTPYLFMW